MLTRYSNGLGILLLVVIMGLTPLVPAAVSATVPQWTWDSEGRVHDASGQYQPMTEKELYDFFGWTTKEKLQSYPSMIAFGSGSGAGDSSGGGCK